MKINKDYVLRNVAGESIVVPTGEASQKINGMMTLNETAAFLWENVEKVQTEEDLVKLLLDEFEVEKEIAVKDVSDFVRELTAAGIIEN